MPVEATTAAIAVTMTDTVGVLTLNSARLNILGGLNIGNDAELEKMVLLLLRLL